MQKTVLKLTQNIVTACTIVLSAVFVLRAGEARAQWRQVYDGLSVYVVAHQDDWQLFMGTNVYNDIMNYDEKNPAQNGTKVVIIYTTAGNLNDDDDAQSCNCKDPYSGNQPHYPYWRVREAGTKNSVHLAACRLGGWGNTNPYPQNKTVHINGHKLIKYDYKNTTSYFLRLKAGMYNKWGYKKNIAVETVDSSTRYADWADFVSTLYYIYKAEMDSSIVSSEVHFSFPDINAVYNPNDHSDHIIAGRAACEAARLLSNEMNKCFPESLFVDYNTQNLPPNQSLQDAQNATALVGVYCMSLLDYNAWPEWGGLYREWTGRNYFRTINTCKDAIDADNILSEDSLADVTVKVFPSPANNLLNLRFNVPVKSTIQVRVIDVAGTKVFETDTTLNSENTLSINTSGFRNGSYMVMVGADGRKLTTAFFEVIH